MLKCIICGKEYPERYNFTNDGCHKNPLFTTLYSTTIPDFKFPESPIERQIDSDIFLKREDKNPFSKCFKDRKAKYILSTKVHRFALASCGNQAKAFLKCGILDPIEQKPYNGVSSGTIFGSYNYEPLKNDMKLYLPNTVSYEKLQELKVFNPTIVDKILTTEELLEGPSSGRWNVTNGMDPVGASAIYSLGMELEPYNFNNLVVPMGSGELYSMLSVYFKILRKKDINIIPVKCHHPIAEAIKTTFVPMVPFIEHFNVEPHIASNIESITVNAERTGCCHSSAVVFEPKNLNGKTCLIITGK